MSAAVAVASPGGPPVPPPNSDVILSSISASMKRMEPVRRRGAAEIEEDEAMPKILAGDNPFPHTVRAPDVGPVDSPEHEPIRVVCISDTHGKHNLLRGNIPRGDILLHTGDFCTRLSNGEFYNSLKEMEDFFSGLPHVVKLFVAGNHETAFNLHKAEEIQAGVPSVVYLEDSAFSAMGLRFFASPWNNTLAGAFGAGRGLALKWDRIPDHVDILMTHQPPFNILDRAFKPKLAEAKESGPCDICDEVHPTKRHWGCPTLLQRVQTIKPFVHVFGHVHDEPGWKEAGETVFINAASALSLRPVWFQAWVPKGARNQPATAKPHSAEGVGGVVGERRAAPRVLGRQCVVS